MGSRPGILPGFSRGALHGCQWRAILLRETEDAHLPECFLINR
jgi:hypothetical protein